MTSEPEAHAPITVDVVRGPIVESRHVVYGALWQVGDRGADVGRLVACWGDPGLVTYLRSSLKPFQTLPLVADGVADRLGLSEAEIALVAGSHSGQAEHLETLDGLMAKTGVRDEALRCGTHRPFHATSSDALRGPPTVRHHNCSANHVGMLAWARHQEVVRVDDAMDYTDPTHPIQRRIREWTAHLAGLPSQDVVVGIDGCAAPTLGVSLASMARLFGALGDPESLRGTTVADSFPDSEWDRILSGLARIRDAMRTNPLLVAGTGRADTALIEATAGRCVSKSGAEGVWCGVDTERRLAWAFKTIDGEFRAAVPAALSALAARRTLSDAEQDRLATSITPPVRTRVGDEVGHVQARLP